ncbi:MULTISPECIES: hypothetical protein [Planktothricoides]|uniref:Uncharacterized protein n=1 Tax=Planktothricoides raciborskii FACHB-1370 TaxID=2949576 RepID=A0ABR8EJD9_9CYAN|nr:MULTISPECIES: hypothetical protein [Planktothricoides]KOR37245.1 hypothetical protein AM228_08610 [Planktothricoides sp. SR001]MBD2545746.1 hypothetical protein [Planktothricoides raciborskii FACHB-1370]MBD2582683.1 hypothetical protein [Planktothricoides raciborskii FACHB-1261]
MSNNQWVEIVAKLTLARSILASAILDIDNAVCDIERGDLSLSKQSVKILETMIADLMANSDDIGEKAVYIPDVFLQLDRQFSQSTTQTESLEKLSQSVSESLVNWNNFDSYPTANGLSRKAS